MKLDKVSAFYQTEIGYFYGSSIADTVLKSAGSAPPTLPPPLEITIAI